MCVYVKHHHHRLDWMDCDCTKQWEKKTATRTWVALFAQIIGLSRKREKSFNDLKIYFCLLFFFFFNVTPCHECESLLSWLETPTHEELKQHLTSKQDLTFSIQIFNIQQPRIRKRQDNFRVSRYKMLNWMLKAMEKYKNKFGRRAVNWARSVMVSLTPQWWVRRG